MRRRGDTEMATASMRSVNELHIWQNALDAEPVSQRHGDVKSRDRKDKTR